MPMFRAIQASFVKIIMVSLIFGSIPLIANDQLILADRILFEVNNTPYSQRQLELYYYIKIALMTLDKPNIEIINQHNWPKMLEMYKTDIIILQEAQRLGVFRPTEQTIATAKEVVKQKILKHSALRQQLERLEMTDEALDRTIAAVIRVEAFKRSKEKQEHIQDKHSRKPQGWVSELLARTLIRNFEEADQYRNIQSISQK